VLPLAEEGFPPVCLAAPDCAIIIMRFNAGEFQVWATIRVKRAKDTLTQRAAGLGVVSRAEFSTNGGNSCDALGQLPVQENGRIGTFRGGGRVSAKTTRNIKGLKSNIMRRRARTALPLRKQEKQWIYYVQ